MSEPSQPPTSAAASESVPSNEAAPSSVSQPSTGTSSGAESDNGTSTASSPVSKSAASESSLGQSIRDALREYATTDPRTLGLFRILFAILMLVDLFRRVPDYVFFYTNEGMLPNHASLYKPMSGSLFSLYHAASTRQEVLWMFGLTGVAYLMLLVGWKTRFWQVVSLVLLTSLHSRNIMLENGGDVVGNLLALWTVFLPLGKRFSVDSWLRSWRTRDEKNEIDLNDRSSPRDDNAPIVSVALVAALLNLFCIYYFNTVHKDGWVWRQGVTVHYVLFADRLVNPLGAFLRPFMLLPLIKVLTVGTLAIEASIFLLLLSPIWIRACRRVAWLLIIALHCGFQSVGHFGLFSFTMMLYATLLMGREDWESLAARMEKILPARVVIYDGMCGICLQICRVLKRLDNLGKLEFVPNYAHDRLPAGVTPELCEQTVVVASRDGSKHWVRGEAVSRIFRSLPYGWAVARVLDLPGIRSLLDTAYRAVAERRQSISVAIGLDACGIERPDPTKHVTVALLPEPPPLFPRLQRFVVGSFLGLMMVSLTLQVFAENRKIPEFLKPPPVAPQKITGVKDAWRAAYFYVRDKTFPFAQYPRFFQGWSMFAPIPPTDDGVIVVDAVTVDGRHIDPLRQGLPTNFELPDSKHGMMVSQFWYEFHDRLRREPNAKYRDYFRDWLVNWHRIERRPSNDQIVSFEAFWISRQTQEAGSLKRNPVVKQSIMTWKQGNPETPPPSPPTKAPPRLPPSVPAPSASH
ncbi:MAG: DCC1-like thiol-disulfide oxidoreductase family protein [Polyangiaceae bacterium]